ncbi:MAG: hypothetical protein ACRYG7_07810 [Janthinobacterium lividum]
MTPEFRRQRAPAAGLTSSYTLERRLLRQYSALFQEATQTNADFDRLILACLGEVTPAKREAADERLQHAIPELIRKLRPDQQQVIAELLLSDAGDLAAAVRELIRMENGLWRRDEDPRLRTNDDWRLKAAGLGHLSKKIYGPIGAH